MNVIVFGHEVGEKRATTLCWMWLNVCTESACDQFWVHTAFE